MEGKVCLVTGGAQGIGKAFCSSLLHNGAKVVFCDINEATGKETQEELARRFGNDRVQFYVCDVADSPQLTGCFDKTVQNYGGLDLLINNAGVCDEREHGWRRMIDINLNALVQGTKLGFKYMSRGQGGRGGMIVNIASITCLQAWECIPVYSATKAAINQLSRCFGADVYYEQSGVKVISINPGLTDTAILDDVRNKSVSDRVRRHCPLMLKPHPIQKVDNMGIGLIQVLSQATNGSIWTIENDASPLPSVIHY